MKDSTRILRGRTNVKIKFELLVTFYLALISDKVPPGNKAETLTTAVRTVKTHTEPSEKKSTVVWWSTIT